MIKKFSQSSSIITLAAFALSCINTSCGQKQSDLISIREIPEELIYPEARFQASYFPEPGSVKSAYVTSDKIDHVVAFYEGLEETGWDVRTEYHPSPDHPMVFLSRDNIDAIVGVEAQDDGSRIVILYSEK
jgi:hypothetical protein